FERSADIESECIDATLLFTLPTYKIQDDDPHFKHCMAKILVRLKNYGPLLVDCLEPMRNDLKRTTNTKQLEFIKQGNLKYRQENDNENLSPLLNQIDEEEPSLRKRRDEMNIKETTTSPMKKTKTMKVAVETKIKQKRIVQLFGEMRKRGIYILVQPFKSLSQADAEELFERIAQNTVVKIDLPDFIEKYLQDLLNGNIESVFRKVRNPPSKDAKPLLLWTSEIYQRPTSSNRGDKNDAVIYQDQNATIIYEQSFGPTEFDETHYLEDIAKLARNSVDDLNFHFIQYSNSSITTAKNFKSISIHGYKYFISIYLTDLVRAKTYRIYEVFKCKIPTTYTERWLLKKIANLGIYLETLLTERQSIKAKMCEEDARMENSQSCVSDWITIPDNTPDKKNKMSAKK
ncbi:761_t:CDS:2, partial [Acaulospora colombiana]